MSDNELFFRHAKHTRNLNFYNADVLSDPDLMKEVVEHQPQLVKLVEGEAASDLSVLFVALSTSCEFAKDYLLEAHLVGHDNFPDFVLCFIQRRLGAFDTFFKCILGNMLSAQSVEQSRSNLTLLNQGIETSFKYKNLLAEYADIPRGAKWLRQLRAAEKNASQAIALWARITPLPE